MGKSYRPLPSRPMAPGTSYHRLFPKFVEPRVRLESPATDAMTNLRRTPAVTITPNESLDEANGKMIAYKVRMLLVVNGTDEILGLITATDILGEKPLRYLKEVRGRRSEILVRDIMTPCDALDVLRLTDVEQSRVGDIIAHLREVGRQHALVADYSTTKEADEVIGLFSTSQIGRQLGTSVTTTEVARTFAEKEAALMEGERGDRL